MYKILAKTFFIGKKVIFLPTCHSTNLIAEELVKEGSIIDGTIVITNHQSAGQGQRGNTWESAPGANLTFSIIFKPTFLNIQEQFYLNIALSLGVTDFLSAKGCQNVKVKWPNDIYCDNKKICGILIKNNVKRNFIDSTIAGIGLNINQTVFDTPNATSLALALGNTQDLPTALEELAHCIEGRYLRARNSDLQALKEDYLDNLYWAKERRVYKSEHQFHGVIEGIDPLGRLQIRTDHGLKTFSYKEVQFIN